MLIPSLLALALSVPAAAGPKNPDTLVYAAFWDVDSLDPGWAESMAPLFNLYEPLVDYDGAGYAPKDLSGRLATTVPTRQNGLLSADGRTYRFPIRKGVKFHDGTILTPEDVRYSLLRFMLTDRPGGASASLLNPIAGLPSTRVDGKPVDGIYERVAKAVRVDGDDVVVTLDHPFAPFLSVLANFGRVVSKTWCVAHGQWDGRKETWLQFNGLAREASIPVSSANGTGPFALEARDPATGRVILVRHDGYWRRPARLKRVVILNVPEFNTRKLMLLAGDADVIGVLPAQAGLLKGAPGVEVTENLRKLQTPAFLAFTVNVDTAASRLVGTGALDGGGVPPDFFADADMRLAFAHAIDYGAYVRDALSGHGEPFGGLIPIGLSGYRPGPPSHAYDLKTSEALFRKAFGGRVWEKGFVLSLIYHQGYEDEAAALRMLKKNVEALNPRFKLEVRAVANATFSDWKRGRKMPLTLTAWTADYPDPHDFAFPVLHSAGAMSKLLGYSNPRMDALIEEAARTPDGPARAALYGRIQTLFDQDAPFAPIAVKTHARVQRSWVKGFVFNPAVHGEPYESVFYDLYKSD